MKHKDGRKKPSYDSQVSIDEKEQIIVAADLVDKENDLHPIEPMIENVKETLGYKSTVVLADAGYFSYDNVKFLLDEEILNMITGRRNEWRNIMEIAAGKASKLDQ